MQVSYTAEERGIVDVGLEAHSHLIKTVEYWINVGKAMEVLFAKGERLGRKGFVALQIQEGFVTRDGKPIDKGPISKARQMAKHEAAVLAWRDSLTPKQRDTWNNPNSVFTHCPVFATDKPARTPPAAPTRKMPVEPKLEAWAQPKPATEVLQAKEARNAEDEAKALEAAERARQAQIENLGLKSEVEDLSREVKDLKAKLQTQPLAKPVLLEDGSAAAMCSFCDKSQLDVFRMIKGRGDNLYICNECVALCTDIVREATESTAKETKPKRKRKAGA